MEPMSDPNTPSVAKPVAREPRFTKLRACSCFAEAHERILQGWPLAEVARFIQEENQEYTDVEPESLVAQLKEYRSTLDPALLASVRLPKPIIQAAKKVEKGLDELDALEKLYGLQMERIDIDLNVEKSIKKLIPTMTQEVRVAREILQTYADLKMDLGLSKRHIGQIEVDTHVVAEVTAKYGKPSVTKVMASPESRRKVLSVTDKILQLAQAKTTAPASEQTIEAETTPTKEAPAEPKKA